MRDRYPDLLSDMLVVYGNRVSAKALHEQLVKHFGLDAVWWLNKKETKDKPPPGYGSAYLRLANVESATGLEAGVVFLLGIEDLVSATAFAAFIEGSEETMVFTEKRARKLYMAMTRAGQSLVLLTSEPVSALIASAFASGSDAALPAPGRV